MIKLLIVLKFWKGLNLALISGLGVGGITTLSPWLMGAALAAASLDRSLNEWVAELTEHLKSKKL
jgi:hypothetical protein